MSVKEELKFLAKTLIVGGVITSTLFMTYYFYAIKIFGSITLEEPNASILMIEFIFFMSVFGCLCGYIGYKFTDEVK